MAKSTFDTLVHRVRIGQFVSVGMIGVTIETVIVAMLTTIAGIGPLTAKAVGAESSISTMFVINDRWTFSEEGDVGWVSFVQRWGKSHLVRMVGLVIAFTILYFLTHVVEFRLPIYGLDLWPALANVIGISIGAVINYVAESLITWRVTDTEIEESG